MAYTWKKQASSAYGLSLTQLVLNTVMFAEELPEQYEGWMDYQKQTDRRLILLVKEFLDGQDILDEVKDLRRQAEKEMNTVISYTDAFLVYEYALNRLERRFCPDMPDVTVKEQEFVSQLTAYIFGGEDSNAVNMRIQEVVSQLPVRFTRQKYYSMVKDSLQAYVGAYRDTLDQMMYMLSIGSMSERNCEDDSLPLLNQLLKDLQELSFKTMDADTYHMACGKTQEAGIMLRALADYCQSEAEILNSLYVLCLTREDAMRNVAEEKQAFRILAEFCRICEGREQREPEEWEDQLSGLEEMLESVEGLQEEYYDRYLRLEQPPFSETDESDEAKRSRWVDMLLSGSAFVMPEKQADQSIVKEEDIEEAMKGYIAVMDPVLTSVQKPVARAIMATSLSILPVFFNSAEEIHSYIENSLGSCTDPFEKATCMELLQQIMEN